MNKVKLREVVVGLRYLSKGIRSGYSDSGVCSVLDDLLEETELSGYEIVERASPSWEHYSGDPTYPVGDDYDRGNLWEGDSGKLRRDLCRYVADWMEDEYDLVTEYDELKAFENTLKRK